MEQKKVQRIIGIVVVIALVIIVMPLFFGKNNFPIQESSNIKAPPFPDQQPTKNTTPDLPTPTLASAPDMDKDSSPVPQNNPSSPVADNNKLADAQKMDDPSTPKMNDPSTPGSIIYEPVSQPAPVSPAKENVTPAVAKNESGITKTEPAIAQTEPAIAQTEPVTTKTEPPIAQTESVITKTEPAIAQTESVITEPTLAKMDPVLTKTTPEMTKTEPVTTEEEPINSKKTKPAAVKGKMQHSITQSKVKSLPSKSPAWVVQMGNFSVKQNAIHLTTLLRAAGYKAFTREVKSPSGKINTRVYVGPEFQQASAVQLSKEITQKLRLQGFVLSYKPIRA